jgi:hypothetical protein
MNWVVVGAEEDNTFSVVPLTLKPPKENPNGGDGEAKENEKVLDNVLDTPPERSFVETNEEEEGTRTKLLELDETEVEATGSDAGEGDDEVPLGPPDGVNEKAETDAPDELEQSAAQRPPHFFRDVWL